MGHAKNRSLYWRLSRHRASGEGLSKEDFFTELWAFLLQRNETFLSAVLEVVGINTGPGVWTVETQAEYPPAPLAGCAMPCRPDLRLACGSTRILFEHKIDAQQHGERVTDAFGNVRVYSQLERYLAVDAVADLALVALKPTPIAPSVLACSRYRRPPGREHFLWRDFFSAADQAARDDKAGGHLSELIAFMAELGMQPPREGVGVIPSANMPGMEAERNAWKFHWCGAIRLLEANGWTRVNWGLEVEFTRGKEKFPSLYLDMRYRERAGIQDGVLKARLRCVAEEGQDGKRQMQAIDRLVREFQWRGFSAKSEPTRASNAGHRPRIDVVCETKCTRTEFIGEGDPDKRLKEFALEVVGCIHDKFEWPVLSE